MFDKHRRLKLLDAGTPIRDILWHPTDPSVMLIAASNGFVNALKFQHPASGGINSVSEFKVVVTLSPIVRLTHRILGDERLRSQGERLYHLPWHEPRRNCGRHWL